MLRHSPNLNFGELRVDVEGHERRASMVAVDQMVPTITKRFGAGDLVILVDESMSTFFAEECDKVVGIILV